MLGEGPEVRAVSAISFDHVSLVYANADIPAVDEVTLDVSPGELVVLLGPSGCGKTTLLKMVNRLLEPTSGEIFIGGRAVSQFKRHELRRSIGYVIQQTGLFPHMRVEANVAVVPKLLGWDKARISARVDELLELVGLPPDQFRRRYPAQLSGGQQQRVGLARALAGDPEMILMDEPFGALDAITRARLQDELVDIQQRLQRTILFVTHDIDEAVKIADRIVVMRDGRVQQYDTPLRIILNPANDFVGELVGARDIMRRLSLILVESVMREPGVERSDGQPAVTGQSDLRAALTAMLARDTDWLAVVDADDRRVGEVHLDDIRQVSVERPEPAVRMSLACPGQLSPACPGHEAIQ
jgi:osmoprotectant transport system ATP-binding protein